MIYANFIHKMLPQRNFYMAYLLPQRDFYMAYLLPQRNFYIAYLLPQRNVYEKSPMHSVPLSPAS